MNERLKRIFSSDHVITFLVTAIALFVRITMANYFVAGEERGLTLFIPDDAYYYFSIARSFVHGLGVSIDGIHATNGMHPLWLFLISPFFLIQHEPLNAIVYFQALLDTVVVVLIADTIRVYLAHARPSNRKTAIAMAALLYAIIPGFYLRSSLGMETTIAALFIIEWLRQIRRISFDRTLRFWIVLGVLTGLLFLARTDMFVLVLPTVLWIVIRFRKELPWKNVLFATAITLIVVLPWLAWNLTHFGSIVQSSAKAVALFAMKKYDILYGPLGKYWQLVIVAARNIFKPFVASTFGVSIITFVCAIIHNRKERRSDITILLLMLTGGILLLTTHSLFRGFIRDWYVEELIPLFLIGFGVTMGFNAGSTAASIRGRVLLGLLLIGGIVFQQRHTNQSWQLPMERATEGMASWMEPGKKVGAFNSGIFSYYAPTPRCIVNLDGVVNADIIPYLEHGNLHEYLEKDSIDYIMDYQGTIGGYIGLFDRHLLDDFTPIANRPWIDDTFVIYRRKTPRSQ